MRLFILFFLSTCIIGSVGNAQISKTEKTKVQLIAAIDSILNNAVVKEEIPGAVIEIKQDGKIIYKHAYGFSQKYDFGHRLLSHPAMMNTETMFDMASLTKVIGTTTTSSSH